MHITNKEREGVTVNRLSGAEASVGFKRRNLCGILSERMADPDLDVTGRDNILFTE